MGVIQLRYEWDLYLFEQIYCIIFGTESTHSSVCICIYFIFNLHCNAFILLD